jgi:2-methylfumaryl-CoA hydratase
VLSVKASSSNPNLGVVHVQTTGRNQHGQVVLTFQRKVQVWKRDPKGAVADDTVPPDTIEVALDLPAYDPKRAYRDLAYLTGPDSYLEDFRSGDVIEHWRGRVVTTDHIMLTGILDNTSQVHCNQWMIDADPERFLGGQLIVFGGIPFNLCLGLSSPDIGENSLGDVRYATGRHTAPVFAGDTVFASTEIKGTKDLPGRPDLGVLETILRGHKFKRKDGKAEGKDAAAERVEIFYLERELAVKRRSHYA